MVRNVKLWNDYGHVKRFRAQETDLNSIIFQNRDGTKTMYYFAYPVKYTDELGVTRRQAKQCYRLY